MVQYLVLWVKLECVVELNANDDDITAEGASANVYNCNTSILEPVSKGPNRYGVFQCSTIQYKIIIHFEL